MVVIYSVISAGVSLVVRRLQPVSLPASSDELVEIRQHSGFQECIIFAQFIRVAHKLQPINPHRELAVAFSQSHWRDCLDAWLVWWVGSRYGKDRQTDGQTTFRWMFHITLTRSSQRCSIARRVKKKLFMSRIRSINFYIDIALHLRLRSTAVNGVQNIHVANQWHLTSFAVFISGCERHSVCAERDEN